MVFKRITRDFDSKRIRSISEGDCTAVSKVEAGAIEERVSARSLDSKMPFELDPAENTLVVPVAESTPRIYIHPNCEFVTQACEAYTPARLTKAGSEILGAVEPMPNWPCELLPQT